MTRIRKSGVLSNYSYSSLFSQGREGRGRNMFLFIVLHVNKCWPDPCPKAQFKNHKVFHKTHLQFKQIKFRKLKPAHSNDIYYKCKTEY